MLALELDLDDIARNLGGGAREDFGDRPDLSALEGASGTIVIVGAGVGAR
jgi:hypothetical protein